jgi:hypothetical protein
MRRRILVFAMLLMAGSALALQPSPAGANDNLGYKCIRHDHTANERAYWCSWVEYGLNGVVRGQGRLYSNVSTVHVQIEDIYLYRAALGGTFTRVATCRPTNCPKNSQHGYVQTSTPWWSPCLDSDLFYDQMFGTVRWTDGTLSPLYAVNSNRSQSALCR